MEAVLSQRVHKLVADGWEPRTTTETTASLVGQVEYDPKGIPIKVEIQGG